ncbi:YybH family protein [Algoriphagus namhaensis]|uniref:YybH family protein n=2 Tax=Algoriphagus namhaensis TaxID=915353 RepID=A0ABV8AKZ5_9BACT
MMKYLASILLLAIFSSCQQTSKEEEKVSKLDIPAELEKIEQLRAAFQNTVKEKRYDDLRKFAAPDMISVGPGSEDWVAYRKLREEHGNKFRYDSIKMRPKETVIVSDSIAYDFGVSTMYYTDENGDVQELEDTFLMLLKRTKDGEWKMFREIASSLVDD